MSRYSDYSATEIVFEQLTADDETAIVRGEIQLGGRCLGWGGYSLDIDVRSLVQDQASISTKRQ